MNKFNIIFFGLYATLFATPLVAMVARKRIEQFRKGFYIFALSLLLAVLVAIWFGVSFLGIIPDVLVLFSVYTIIGVCIFQLSTHKSIVAKFAGGIGALPFIVLPLLSVPALLGVALVVGDYEPQYSIYDDQGYLCRVTSYGNATTPNGGYEATLYKIFGFFEYAVDFAAVDNTRKAEVTPEVVCNVVLAELKS